MGSDRELLELAAKAAGIELEEWDEEEQAYWISPRIGDWWNPILHDGDALRLAVQLEIDFSIEMVGDIKLQPGFCSYHVNVWYVAGGVELCAGEDGHNGSATTRRAIVRAAAEIGRAMK